MQKYIVNNKIWKCQCSQSSNACFVYRKLSTGNIFVIIIRNSFSSVNFYLVITILYFQLQQLDSLKRCIHNRRTELPLWPLILLLFQFCSILLYTLDRANECTFWYFKLFAIFTLAWIPYWLHLLSRFVA